jgi:tetratricopeptide (TPR) repeat protein
VPNKAATTFERRFEDWSVSHPKRWIPTASTESAAAFISDQTEKIVSAQLKAADRIIVSQERVASGIDEVGVKVDRVADGLEGLASAFDWGFTEMVWQLEQHRETLKQILDVLRAPLDTQAKELRYRAEDAYNNGWIEDALEDFLDSEKKNRYDFTIHQSLGNIYLFHKKTPEKALEYYEKAVKYATPKSPYHASLGFLHIGLIKYLQEDRQKAYEAAIEAIKLYPKLYEAHYDCARYCACLGNYDEAIDHLWEAIQGDRNYYLKASSEKDFDVMKEQLNSSIENKHNKAQRQASEEVYKAEELIAYAESCGLSTSGESGKFKRAVEKYGTANEFLKRASLFDCQDATYKAWDAQELTIDALESYVADQISRAFEEHTIEIKNLEDGIDKIYFWIFGPLFLILCAILVLGYIGAAIGLFLDKKVAGGILWLVFGVIFIAIDFFVLALVFLALNKLIKFIGWPISYVLSKSKESRYERRLAGLHNKLSEVRHKRDELNLEYEQNGRS